MIDPAHFNTYSIQARVCLGVAAFGAALLFAEAVARIYFVQ
ncbi:hypothetical protein AB7008_37115 [Bradyrhizobium sp. 521_C7_N1_3]|nr:hypothetical protein [Bradyrhizobium japonicum]MCS3495523.1 hypothetical protein [Bradyrhizobium japonicum]MCS3962315.1 hypothetical protein [Bradyrhizobium japonicum]MCS3994632.1 hypothetical protein [Bradyrhizobium japonicum]MCW2220767.1 hypothetical protein [Bradyrhizobium japonicum]MCW2345381.1 hypothetical protein [Bradyrhizobium japonicum]